MRPLHCLFAFLLLGSPAGANVHRAVWFWNSATSPYGSANIVGTGPLENQTIAFWSARGIRRVYGSYQDRPVTEPSVIAAWNAKLQGAGIQSQLLLDGTDDIFVSERPDLIARIDDRLIAFNNAPGRLPAERFDALHLDLEPQGLPEWGPPPPAVDLTPAQKRDYLLLLRDTFAAVRQHLDDQGLVGFPLYADLPVTWDKLPGDGGSIGWADAAERDQWFDDVAASLTGVTLMAFQRDSFASIDAGVDWERAHLGGATVRVGVQPILGASPFWPSLPDFNNILTTLEGAYGPTGAVDLENHRLWREAIATQPILPAYAVLQPVDLAGGALVIGGETNWTYVVQVSSDLCLWREVRRFKAPSDGPFELPVAYGEGPVLQFLRVVRFADLESPR